MPTMPTMPKLFSKNSKTVNSETETGVTKELNALINNTPINSKKEIETEVTKELNALINNTKKELDDFKEKERQAWDHIYLIYKYNDCVSSGAFKFIYENYINELGQNPNNKNEIMKKYSEKVVDCVDSKKAELFFGYINEIYNWYKNTFLEQYKINEEYIKTHENTGMNDAEQKKINDFKTLHNEIKTIVDTKPEFNHVDKSVEMLKVFFEMSELVVYQTQPTEQQPPTGGKRRLSKSSKRKSKKSRRSTRKRRVSKK
jgi:hypothetical protein